MHLPTRIALRRVNPFPILYNSNTIPVFLGNPSHKFQRHLKRSRSQVSPRLISAEGHAVSSNELTLFLTLHHTRQQSKTRKQPKTHTFRVEHDSIRAHPKGEPNTFEITNYLKTNRLIASQRLKVGEITTRTLKASKQDRE